MNNTVTDLLDKHLQETHDLMLREMGKAIYEGSKPPRKATVLEKINRLFSEVRERIALASDVLVHGHDCY